MNARSQQIGARLKQHGAAPWNNSSRPEFGTGIPEADALVADLEHHPHAFVLACVMNRQWPTEKVWAIPYQVSQSPQCHGDFSFETLKQLTSDQVRELFTTPKPLHYLSMEMAKNFFAAIRQIETKYGGNAARIWSDEPSSATAVFRFPEFQGVGPKIATMAVNILARAFKIPFSDYYSIDISVDAHVKRVFGRLGPRKKMRRSNRLFTAQEKSIPNFLEYLTYQSGKSENTGVRQRRLRSAVSAIYEIFVRLAHPLSLFSGKAAGL